MMVLAISIFLIAYFIIITEKVHRTVIALFAAALMVVLGIISQHQAIEGIDFNMLGILIGMMVIVGIAKHSGIFQYIAIWAAKAGKGKPIPIFLLLAVITMVFSAILDDVTTVLLMVPVVFVIAQNLRVSPKPYLFSAIMLANIGGAATLIGDQPNILIGSAANLSFNDFLIHMGPIALIVGVLTLGLLALLHRKEMVTNKAAQKTIMQFQPRDAITNKSLLVKSLIVLALVILGFLTHNATGIEGATLALSGAALLLLITLHEPEEYIRDIEWTTIFFFVGLFIMVTGLEHVGAIELLANKLIEVTGGNFGVLMISTLWGSAIFSAIVDNVPFVAIMIPLIKELGVATSLNITPLWWALAMGADFGGNATLIGASANVVVSGMAEKAGHKLSFVEYMKTAVPLSLLAIILSTVYVCIRYIL